MEMKKKEGNSVRPTLCRRHPQLELTHFCAEADCKGALFCTECARQKHRNHQTIPLKEICETKLSYLKVMKDAIEQNREKVQSARKKLKDNKAEMHYLFRRRLDEFHAQLDQVAKKNVDHLDKLISEAHGVLTAKENDIRKAEDLLKGLETEFSDKISNTVRANADKHLDWNFKKLYDMLDSWSLRYSLLRFMDLELLANSDKDWVSKMPEQTVRGAPVNLLMPVVPPVPPAI